jgi:hypothetical protein
VLEQSIFARGCFNDARQSKGLSPASHQRCTAIKGFVSSVPSTMHGDPSRDRMVCSLQSKGVLSPINGDPYCDPSCTAMPSTAMKGCISLRCTVIPLALHDRRVCSLPSTKASTMHSDPVSRCTAILTNQRACLPPTAIEGRVSHGDPMAIPLSHNGDPIIPG